MRALLIAAAVVAAPIPLALAVELDQSPASSSYPPHVHKSGGHGLRCCFLSLRPFRTLQPKSTLSGGASSGYGFSYGGSYETSTPKLKYRAPRLLYPHH